MTTTAEAPVLTFEEKFAVALMRAGMTHKQFAEHVGVTRKTVWTWQKEAVAPQVGALRVLAAEADVSYEWLIEGLGLPRLDSNQQPADYVFALLYDPIAEAEALLAGAVL